MYIGEKSKFHADSDTPSTQPTSQKSTNPSKNNYNYDYVIILMLLFSY